MEYIAIAYLLLKSWMGAPFTKFDRLLADILEDVPGCPEVIYEIANLNGDVPYREAWSNFWTDVCGGAS